MSMKEWIVFGLSPCVVEWNDVQVAPCRQIISHWCYRLIISELLTCYISVEGHEWCWGLDNLSIDLVGTNVEVSDPLIRLGHLWGSILVFGSFKSPRHFSIVTTRTKQMTLVKKIFQTEKSSRAALSQWPVYFHITQLTWKRFKTHTKDDRLNAA